MHLPPGSDDWRRRLLVSFCSAKRLTLHIPETYMSPPPNPWSAWALVAPISRVPYTTRESPSLLDYACASAGVVTEAILHWRHANADHALVEYVCSAKCAVRRHRISSWRPRDEKCVETVDGREPPRLSGRCGSPHCISVDSPETVRIVFHSQCAQEVAGPFHREGVLQAGRGRVAQQ